MTQDGAKPVFLKTGAKCTGVLPLPLVKLLLNPEGSQLILQAEWQEVCAGPLTPASHYGNTDFPFLAFLLFIYWNLHICTLHWLSEFQWRRHRLILIITIIIIITELVQKIKKKNKTRTAWPPNELRFNYKQNGLDGRFLQSQTIKATNKQQASFTMGINYFLLCTTEGNLRARSATGYLHGLSSMSWSTQNISMKTYTGMAMQLIVLSLWGSDEKAVSKNSWQIIVPLSKSEKNTKA